MINDAILIVLALIPLLTVRNTVILILVLLVFIGIRDAVIAVCQVVQILLILMKNQMEPKLSYADSMSGTKNNIKQQWIRR